MYANQGLPKGSPPGGNTLIISSPADLQANLASAATLAVGGANIHVHKIRPSSLSTVTIDPSKVDPSTAADQLNQLDAGSGDEPPGHLPCTLPSQEAGPGLVASNCSKDATRPRGYPPVRDPPASVSGRLPYNSGLPAAHAALLASSQQLPESDTAVAGPRAQACRTGCVPGLQRGSGQQAPQQPGCGAWVGVGGGARAGADPGRGRAGDYSGLPRRQHSSGLWSKSQCVSHTGDSGDVAGLSDAVSAGSGDRQNNGDPQHLLPLGSADAGGGGAAASKRRRLLSQFEQLEECYLNMRTRRPSCPSGTWEAPPPGHTGAAASGRGAGLDGSGMDGGEMGGEGGGGPASRGLVQAAGCAAPYAAAGVFPHATASGAATATAGALAASRPAAAGAGAGGLAMFREMLSVATHYSRLAVLAEVPRPVGSGALSKNCIVSSIEFDLAGGLFATAGASQRISIYDHAEMCSAYGCNPEEPLLPLLEIPTRSKLSCLSYSHGERCQLVVSDYEGMIRLWDTQAKQVRVRGGIGVLGSRCGSRGGSGGLLLPRLLAGRVGGGGQAKQGDGCCLGSWLVGLVGGIRGAAAA